MITRFPGDEPADIEQIGGKAASLVRMAAAGLPVPGGLVLHADFFTPWLADLQQTEAWSRLASASADDWAPLCEELKSLATGLPLHPQQDEVLQGLSELEGLYAVRSSSPEEDLSAASFAGGYETRLGVPAAELLPAIRACFASALDVRVLHYKRQHGFDPLRPRIGVVVQEQVDAEVAGVGFSLDPLSNDFDHAVVDASWGLGESVVSGAVTPDHFVVDKVSQQVLERSLGDKAVDLRLAEGGGTEQRPNQADGYCLSDEQLAELTGAISQLEDLLGKPVDMEFAFSKGQLYLLQARPITTWVPLPQSLQTEPGERRRLYMDLGLSGGLTINEALSPLGESWMTRFALMLVDRYLGLPLPFEMGPTDALWTLAGGRMYQDMSNVLWLSSPGMLAMNMRMMDALSGDTMAAIPAREYRARKLPAWISPWLVYLYPRAVWRLRSALWGGVQCVLWPRKTKERYLAEREAYLAEMSDLPAEWSFVDLAREKGARVISYVLGATMPPLMVSMVAQAGLSALVPRRLAALRDKLARGFEGNVVVEMSAALHRLASLLPPDQDHSAESLAEGLAAGDLPEDFVRAWQSFLQRYGWRGPHEMDAARPRYADDPTLALGQVAGMVGADFDPVAVHAQAVAERKEALAQLKAAVGPLRRALVDLLHTRAELFSGVRDDPKHAYLPLFGAVRRRALLMGQDLFEAGRLDRPEQALDLRLEQLEAAQEDETLDLRALITDNRAFLDLAEAHVRAFPLVIDSRGRIIRPKPRSTEPGVLVGQAISPGVVRGPVKVLRRPDDKPIEPGDVLVAHTTDPGWTPLFVNASAVVVEVGGMLQHGALVAREYGKPCVGGISDLLGQLEDGQLVEVDGSAGTVKLL